MTSPAFPPQPWYLGGDLLISAWLLESEALPPAHTLPAGWKPVALGGRAVVGTVFAHYSPGGVLAYEEFLVAVLVHRGGTLRVWIPQIWVTSPNSMAGGRELWGIPKHLADLRRALTSPATIRSSMHAPDGAAQVTLEARLGAAVLPGQWTLPLPTAQHLDGVDTLATNSITSRIRALRATWTFADERPLSFLNGRRALLSLALVPAAITFGRDVRRARTHSVKGSVS